MHLRNVITWVLALAALTTGNVEGIAAAERQGSGPQTSSTAADGNWQPLLPASDATAVYDSLRDRVILFGGQQRNDTWTLSLSAPEWTPLIAVDPPPVRANFPPVAIVDELHDRLVTYWTYSRFLPVPPFVEIRNEVWFLSLTGAPTWTRMEPSGVTPIGDTTGYLAVYDRRRNRMLLYVMGTNDVWALNLVGQPSWEEVVPSGSTPTISGGTAVLDPVSDQLLICGGGDPSGYASSAVWALSLGDAPAWQYLGEIGQGRTGHSTIYDPVADRLVVFGGGYSIPGNTNHWLLSSVISFALPQHVANPMSPGGPSIDAREGHKAVYDSRRGRMIVMGGGGYYPPYDTKATTDVWALSLGEQPGWSEVVPGDQYVTRNYGHTAIYDDSNDQMVIFGGYSSGCTFNTEVTALPFSEHSGMRILAPSSPLAPRNGHSAVWDRENARMLVFGGRANCQSGSPFDPPVRFNDVWALSLLNATGWTQVEPLSPSGAPGTASEHVAVFDPLRNQMVTTGGGNYLAWALSLADTATWNPGSSMPTSRDGASAVCDSGRDRMVVFGGAVLWGGGTYYNDVWVVDLSDLTQVSQVFPTGDLPEARRDHCAIYDPIRDRMVVYGGVSADSILTDAWALRLSGTPRWERLAPSGSPPPPTQSPTAIYDPGRDRMVVFDGNAAVWALTFGNSTGRLKWTYSTDGPIGDSCPAIGLDGTIYAGSDDNYLHAIRHDGSLKWKFLLDGGAGAGASPTVGPDGSIYVSAGSSTLYAINPDGTLKWTLEEGLGHWDASPSIGSDGTVYSGKRMTDAPALYAINPNGSIAWSVSNVADMYSAPPIAGDGSIFTNNVYRVHAVTSNGASKWSATISGCCSADAKALASDGTLYVADNGGDPTLGSKLYAFGSNGGVNWEFIVPGPGGFYHSYPAIGSDGTVYIGHQNANLYAVDPDGNLRWTFTAGGSLSQSSPAIGADGTVFFACQDGLLYALNGDGTLSWTFPIGAPASNIVLAPDSTIYFGAQNGVVYAVRANTSPAVGQWPMYGHDPRHTGRVDATCLPQVTTLIAPEPGDSVVGTPALGWSGPACAQQARILLARDANFGSIMWLRSVVGASDMLCANTSFVDGQEYWWKVSLMFEGEWGAWSEPRSFVYQTPPGSLPPAMLFLPQEASELALPELFSCAAISGAATYHFEVAGDPSFSNLLYRAFSQSNSLIIPASIGVLTVENTYYWRARAMGAGGEQGSDSPTRSFVFRTSVGAPPQPNLISPADGSTTSESPVLLQWTWDGTGSVGPTSFDVEYSTSPTFPSIAGQTWRIESVTADRLAVRLSPGYGGPVYWRVASKNDSNAPVWSQSWQFSYFSPASINAVRVLRPPAGAQVPRGSTLIPEGHIAGAYAGPLTFEWWQDSQLIASGGISKAPGVPLIVSGPRLSTDVLGTHHLSLKVTSPVTLESGPTYFEVATPVVGNPYAVRLRCDPGHAVADGVTEMFITASVIDRDKQVVSTDNGRIVQFQIGSGGGTLLQATASTQYGHAQVRLRVPPTPGEAALSAQTTGLLGAQIDIRYAADEVDLLAATAEKYMEELKFLRNEALPIPARVPSYTDGGRLDQFISARVRIPSPALEDTVALRRFILVERALLRAYYHDPGVPKGWESGPSKVISGVLTGIDDFSQSFLGLAVSFTATAIAPEMALAQFGGLGHGLRWLLGKLGDMIDVVGNTPYRWARSMLESSGILPGPTDAILSVFDQIFDEVSNELRAGKTPDEILQTDLLRPVADELFVSHYVANTQPALNLALDYLEEGSVGGTLDGAAVRMADKIGRIDSYTSENHRSVHEWSEQNESYFASLSMQATNAWELAKHIISNPPSWQAAGTLFNTFKSLLEQALFVKDLMRDASSVGVSLASMFRVSQDVGSVPGDAFFPASNLNIEMLASGKAAHRFGKMDPALNHRLLASMSSSTEQYETIVRTIIDRADHGDTTAVSNAVVDLEQAHDALDRDEGLALIPCVASAAAGFSNLGDYVRAYDAAMEAAENAELKRASFNAALGSYLSNPLDATGAPVLHDTGFEALSYAHAARDSISNAVMVVLGESGVSVLSCVDVLVPESLVIGQVVELSARVVALGGAAATEVYLKVSADAALTVPVDSIYVGNMVAGDDSVVTFSVVPTDYGLAEGDSIAYGMFHLIPKSTHGYGMSLSKVITARRSIATGVETPTGRSVTNALNPCYPNPFNPSVTIPFQLRKDGNVTLSVYDVSGRLVQTVLSERKQRGAHTATWDGRNQAGEQVASGVYFCRLRIDGFAATRKIVLLK